MAAPDVFELDDLDGHASAPTESVPSDRIEDVRQAALSCPEQAISVSPAHAGGAAQ